MHAVWLEEINYEHLVYGHPFEKIETLGFGVDYLSMSPIDKVGIDKSGAIETPEYTNETYQPTDIAMTVSYAKMFGSLSTGLSAKFIYRFSDRLSFGLALKNIGTQLEFREKGYNLPLDGRIGVAYKLFDEELVVAVDINKPIDDLLGFRIGVEYDFNVNPKISLLPRAGYKSNVEGVEGMVGLSAGLGFKWSGFALDYAWPPFGQLGDIHRISVGVKF